MTKKKLPKDSPSLSQVIPHSQWTRIREAERITYADSTPARTNWRDRETYTGAELSYRGKQPRKIIPLTGRPL
jgi:hypothetical protein